MATRRSEVAIIREMDLPKTTFTQELEHPETADTRREIPLSISCHRCRLDLANRFVVVVRVDHL